MHNFTISICYKSSFSGLQTIKVTFFILFFLFVPSFLSPLCLPFVSPLCVSPLCLPVVSPQGGDPNATSRGERFAPTRARWWKTKASSVFTGVVYEPIRVIRRQEAVAPSMSQKGQLWCLAWWFCLLSWDNSDVFPGGFASCLGTTLMSFLVVLPSVLG